MLLASHENRRGHRDFLTVRIGTADVSEKSLETRARVGVHRGFDNREARIVAEFEVAVARDHTVGGGFAALAGGFASGEENGGGEYREKNGNEGFHLKKGRPKFSVGQLRQLPEEAKRSQSHTFTHQYNVGGSRTLRSN